MTSLIERYEQSFQLFHQRRTTLNGSDQAYKGVQSSHGDKAVFQESVLLENDDIARSDDIASSDEIYSSDDFATSDDIVRSDDFVTSNDLVSSDDLATSVPAWIPTENHNFVTGFSSDCDEPDSPGASYVAGSPSPSPGPDWDHFAPAELLHDVPEPRGLPPIPEYEYFSGPLQLAEWARLKKGTYKELEFEWSMLCQECTDCWDRSGRRFGEYHHHRLGEYPHPHHRFGEY